MQRHALTDAQWATLQPLLPRRAQGREAAKGDRLFMDAVIFGARTGIPWRDLPERFGNWKSVYNRFRNWAAKDVWSRVFLELRLDVDETASIVDGSIVRAHQDASGGKGGSSRMLWAALEEVFRPRSTRSSTRKGARQLEAGTEAKDPEGPRAVSDALSRRGLLPQPRALSWNRDALREDESKLPRDDPRWLHLAVAQSGIAAPRATTRRVRRHPRSSGPVFNVAFPRHVQAARRGASTAVIPGARRASGSSERKRSCRPSPQRSTCRRPIGPPGRASGARKG